MHAAQSRSTRTPPAATNVPAFLTKLWTLVEDPDTDSLICWSPSGNSFHVFDQGRFSKEVLPKYFKHNNMASFVRQLNMYGFRKVIHIEQGGLVKPEKDDTEFQHPYFIRGQEHLLENIKRKVTSVSNIKHEDLKLSQDEVSKLLSDVQFMRGKQETMDSKIIAMKHENEALWREVASLRQKHAQQQKVVNKLIQFLVTLVQSNRVLGMKRKIPLMLNDSSSAHSSPKFSRQYSLEHLQGTSTFSASSPYTGAKVYSDAPVKSGPIISDVTDLSHSSPAEVTEEQTEESMSPPGVHIKEEPRSPAHSPEVEEVVEDVASTPAETPLSPTTFINSILQENESAPARPQTEQKCLSIACLDKNELTEHLDNIDNGLDNLQTILNGQSINFDPSPLFDVSAVLCIYFFKKSFASLCPLCPAGKQLVQYTAQPVLLADPVSSDAVGEDLPILLQLEGDSYFSGDPEDPTSSLLTGDYQPSKTVSYCS
uniref:Heat shock transcription factor 1 n=1 Tax=Scleropages formosus TaxID=113540 RepID=A0A8C9WEK9_SCLFO